MAHLASRSLKSLLRRPQFSLRLLLMGMTIICCMLGYGRFVVQQRLGAIAEIRRGGGRVIFDNERLGRYAWTPVWLQQKSGSEFFLPVKSLTVKSRDAIRVLDQFPEAYYLWLEIEDLRDDELAALQSKLVPFVDLNISSNALTDTSFDVLRQFKNLRTIETPNVNMSNETLERLRDENSELQFNFLKLVYTNSNTYAGTEQQFLLLGGLFRERQAEYWIVVGRITKSAINSARRGSVLEFTPLETLAGSCSAAGTGNCHFPVEEDVYAAPRDDLSLPSAGALAIIVIRNPNGAEPVVSTLGIANPLLNFGVTRLRSLADPKLAAVKELLRQRTASESAGQSAP